MKRRGFLGFMGGAVAAGPGMAKQAAAAISDLTLPNHSIEQLSPYGVKLFRTASVVQSWDTSGVSNSPWLKRMTSFQVFLASPNRLMRRRLKTKVSELDPDIAQMRSIAMVSKIRMQRDRNFDRWLQCEANLLQQLIHNDLDGEDY